MTNPIQAAITDAWAEASANFGDGGGQPIPVSYQSYTDPDARGEEL
jgi:hypothetical protein